MSDSDEDIPDRETCDRLCKEFASLTKTDTACAQFYLQDRSWNLERSVNAFFESQISPGLNVLQDGDVPELVLNVDKNIADFLKAVQPSLTEPPKNMKFATWNLDGLDENNLRKRTDAVCQIIKKDEPDVIFFQEVVPSTMLQIKASLPEYMCIPGGNVHYFTCTLLRKFTVYYDQHQIIEYPGTSMNRNLLLVEAHIGKLKLVLMNTHLESTTEYAKERIKQMKQCFTHIMSQPSTVVVIFAGDLNARDKEVSEAGLPPDLQDVWESCGSRKECRYSWDMLRNTNKQMPSRYKPRMRFDRVYLRPCNFTTMLPQHFGMIGLEKVENTQSFPSDHWGILVFFDIVCMDSEEDENVVAKKKQKLELETLGECSTGK